MKSVYCEECGVLLAAGKEKSVEAKEGRLFFQPGNVINGRYEIISVCMRGMSESSYLALDRQAGNMKVWIKEKRAVPEVLGRKSVIEALIRNREPLRGRTA